MGKNDNQKADYSEIAEYYDDARPEPADIWIEAIGTMGAIAPESLVLDLGCGTGRFTVRILKRYSGCTFGLDQSLEMLKRAAEKDAGRSVHWIAGDAHTLPLRSDTFDCVYMAMVIHHVREEAVALEEIRRLLKPGGRCVILTSSHSAIRSHVLRYFPGVVATDVNRFPSIPSLKRSLEKAGFRNVRSRLVRHQEAEMPVEKYLQMVRRKYISTFELMDEEKFRKGLGIFEARLKRLYGDRIQRLLAFTFVLGEK